MILLSSSYYLYNTRKMPKFKACNASRRMVQSVSKNIREGCMCTWTRTGWFYGLILSEQDAALILEERKVSLREKERVGFGGGIVPKIIYEFCDSRYIRQENYVDTVVRLQDIFYMFKNEMQDEITDDELLHFMKEQFEDICFGDLEYLESTCLANFAQAIRAGYDGYRSSGGSGGYETGERSSCPFGYRMEELVPIVGELANQYNGYEDTSVTYEKAQQLMGAVLYCIREAVQAEENAVASKEKMPARQMYENGVKAVEEKVKEALKMYNQLLPEFDSYGNRCLYDTVVKGLPEFFKWYDVRFHPQDTILTLDYPILKDISGYTGIDAVYEFIRSVKKEQDFLKRFPRVCGRDALRVL